MKRDFCTRKIARSDCVGRPEETAFFADFRNGMPFFSFRKACFFASVALPLVGCGGGGTSSGSSGDSADGYGLLTIEVDWPAKNTRFVPTYAESLKATLNLQSGALAIVLNRTSDEAYTGSAAFAEQIPVGQHTLIVEAYTEQNAQGSKVASANIGVQILINETTTENVTADLNTTIHHLEIDGQPIIVDVGEQKQLTGHAEDSAGKTILLPDGVLKWSLVSGSEYGEISVDGLFTGIAAGVAVVRLAEPEAGKTVQANVSVVSSTLYDVYFLTDRDDVNGYGINAIYAMFSDGNNLRKITTEEAFYSTPALSADGTKLVFVADINGPEDVYMMNADGSGLTQITFTPEPEMDPSFSPGGDKIVFSRNVGGTWQIFTATIKGGGFLQLTTNEGNKTGPQYSPDGSKIIYENDLDGDFEIWQMNANGSNPEKLTDNDDDDYSPDFSPNGNRLAFISDRNGPVDLYTMNTDGTNVKRHTFTADLEDDPVFTPDGLFILFALEVKPGIFDIAFFDPLTNQVTNLTNHSSNDTEPSVTIVP